MRPGGGGGGAAGRRGGARAGRRAARGRPWWQRGLPPGGAREGIRARRRRGRPPGHGPPLDTPGPERARSRGPMGDRGLRRAEAGAARLRGAAATGSVRLRELSGSEPAGRFREGAPRWAAPPRRGRRAAADEGFVPLHVVQA